MKALFELFRRFDARRIFGFIRRLGGMSRPKVKCYDLRSTRALRVEGDRHRNVDADSRADFYPRPPGRGRHEHTQSLVQTEYISIHALRVEGDVSFNRSCKPMRTIFIHALRVEGDIKGAFSGHILQHNFYPRPPGGGRRFSGFPKISFPLLEKHRHGRVHRRGAAFDLRFCRVRVCKV